jgi:hypothetical protein
MFFLFSGEGPTDLGRGSSGNQISEQTDFEPGPMAIIANKVIEEKLGYPILEGHCGFISENLLGERARANKSARSLRTPRKKEDKQTGYFFRNAQVLAQVAKEEAVKRGVDVIAILFRDSDGTQSAGRGNWDTKWRSIVGGFSSEGYEYGVPMMPKPKSEAWLICSIKSNPYQHCDLLEDRSGNDRSPNALKDELEALMVSIGSFEQIAEWFDTNKISMPSFKAFKARLEEVISSIIRSGAR